jgi:outer membrane lipoprotein carrier protein
MDTRFSLALLGLLALSAPAQAKPNANPTSKPATKSKTASEASPGVGMDPAVKKIVDSMQGFYERNRDFEAHFDQSYHYTSINRTQKSSGTVVIRKARKLAKGEVLAPAMRWDYQTPDPKSIVVTGSAVYMYDPGAQQFTKAAMDKDQLSASVTFLWGQGKLADEFYITRDSTQPGLSLLLVPKKPDSRFDRIFMQVDPKTYAVVGTTVVDPDGSQNHMDFSQVKTDQSVPDERFTLHPPADTQVIDMTKAKSP